MFGGMRKFEAFLRAEAAVILGNPLRDEDVVDVDMIAGEQTGSPW
jgi:hypothetical protein